MIQQIYIQILLNDILAIVKNANLKKERTKTNWKNLERLKIDRNILMEIIFGYIYIFQLILINMLLFVS